MLSNTVITVTPQVAKSLINTVDEAYQRKVSKPTLKKYASDLRNDRWLDKGGVFRISSEGHLLDGRHRCLAVIESGITMPYPVLCIGDIEKKAIVAIDRGKSRTMADLGKLWGLEEAKIVQLARLRMKISGITHPSDQELLAFSQEREDSFSFAIKATSGKNYLYRVSTAPIRLALAEMYERNEEKAIAFADRLVTGVCNYMGDPALTLRKVIFSRKTRGRLGVYRKAVAAAKAEWKGKKVYKWHEVNCESKKKDTKG